MWRDFHDLHVVGNDVFFEPLGDGGVKAWLKIQEDFVSEGIDIEIAFHFAFGSDERGITAFACAQTIYIVCDLAMQKAHAIGASEANATAKAQIEKGCRVI